MQERGKSKWRGMLDLVGRFYGAWGMPKDTRDKQNWWDLPIQGDIGGLTLLFVDIDARFPSVQAYI